LSRLLKSHVISLQAGREMFDQDFMPRDHKLRDARPNRIASTTQ
jgi:hypothetical protein